MGFVKEFKEFAFKGNVIDLAVAVIIGGAFGKIIDSLVKDIITPVLLNPVLNAVGADNIAKLNWHGIAYGNFVSAVINFLCITLVLFILIKIANKAKKEEAPTPPAGPSNEEKLLMEIRDLLKK
ncbi:large conductance mechanosensitive channel protein MscL [Riemerella columbipharyngis]|uniref:Large-conductance mechanosensitive channel n=1 Tax=Riemerella columbipharyngis TaxID=1071918 RepID=A0A1G6YS24_9FLAO|nr:large conductance mechanosensitive channel protein MscL [Riemerella columbipharyngis]SDD92455.1 large conductance mechanosensitive channel [Riemerella columbipharyngis]